MKTEQRNQTSVEYMHNSVAVACRFVKGLNVEYGDWYLQEVK